MAKNTAPYRSGYMMANVTWGSSVTNSPDPADVIALRERIQRRDGLGITAAQDYCASLVHTSRRAWQQWETGVRRMHPAMWELARIKSARRTP